MKGGRGKDGGKDLNSRVNEEKLLCYGEKAGDKSDYTLTFHCMVKEITN